MKLLTFHGVNSREVMDKIRTIFGPDAILVAERTDEDTGRIEILAASPPDDTPKTETLDPDVRARLMNWAESFISSDRETVLRPSSMAVSIPGGGSGLRFLEAGFSADFATSLVSILPLAAPGSLLDSVDPDEADPGHSSRPYTLECLAHAFAQIARFSPLGDIPEHPVFLAGPAGSGKSLTIVKLAARALSAGALPRIIIADPLNLGPGAPLNMFAKVAPVELEIARTPEDLIQLLDAPGNAPIFIDSWGVNPLEAGEIAALSSLTSAARSRNALNTGVIPAGSSRLDAQDATCMFAQLGFSHTIMTRCDTTRMPGATIEAIINADLRFSELGISFRPTPGLGVASPGALARLFPEMCSAPQSLEMGECVA